MEQYASLVGGIATVVAALIAVIGGARVYRTQRDIDFRQELKRERRRVYLEFMRSLVPAVHGDGGPHLSARLEAAQIGSVNVIRALAAYNQYCDATQPGRAARDPEIYTGLIGEVPVAMREDVFEKDGLGANEYSRLLPIS